MPYSKQDINCFKFLRSQFLAKCKKYHCEQVSHRNNNSFSGKSTTPSDDLYRRKGHIVRVIDG